MPPPPDLSGSSPGSAAILERLEHFGVKLGLERVRDLLAADPLEPIRVPTVLVGGTNGKGSTSSLLDAICRAAGLKTGLFTSPHLEDVRERIRVDGRAISEADLSAGLERVLDLAAERDLEPPTFFEALFLAGLARFRTAEVDIAILEVGLGGRLDATNATDPVVSVVTSIGLDHMRILGDSLGAIAREKAGIFRPERPAFAWAEDEEVESALAECAERVGTPLVLANRHCRVHRERSGEVTLEIGDHRSRWDLALPGAHQARNFALAVLAARKLARRGFDSIDEAAIASGGRTVRWPGRLEKVPLPAGGTVVLDAAHNPQGIATLVEELRRNWSGDTAIGVDDMRPDLLFGSLEDRDGAGMLRSLVPLTRRRFLTRPDSLRATDPRELLAVDPEATVEPDLVAAVVRAAPPPGRTLVVAGSIYLVGNVRRTLRERFGVPDPTV